MAQGGMKYMIHSLHSLTPFTHFTGDLVMITSPSYGLKLCWAHSHQPAPRRPLPMDTSSAPRPKAQCHSGSRDVPLALPASCRIFFCMEADAIEFRKS